MLQKGLFNPIETTRVMKDAEFQKYINICARQKGATGGRLIRCVKETFFKTHAKDANEEELQEIWQKVEGPLKNNAGLTAFALDFGGDKSSHFFPWVMSVQKSPSEALEMAYGWGRNLRGEFEFAGNDPWYMEAVRNLPTLAFHRERQLVVANLVTLAKGAVSHEGLIKVVDLGAGRMDWARMHGFVLEPDIMEIIAFDKDPTIEVEQLFPMGKDKANITYINGDITEALTDARCNGADVIIMQGVASYYPREIFAKVLAMVYDLLRDGGAFFFDLQLDCVYYRWSVTTFGWPEMKLMQSAAEAIDLIEGFRKALWEKGYRFGAEYALDTYNKTPAAVMATLTKK